MAIQKVSVVLPVYNEAGNLTPLTAEFDEIFKMLGIDYEIIFVDDHSQDSSALEIAALKKRYAGISYLKHKKNYGQSAAFVSGFRAAEADVIVTMDADGQNVPGDLKQMLAQLERGYDAVYGVRVKRADTRVKKLSSKIGNRFRDLLTGVKVYDAGCSYRIFYKYTLADMPVFNGLHRFLPTLWQIHGFKVGHIAVGHRERLRGVSKYGIRNRAFRGIADCWAMRWYAKRAVPVILLDDPPRLLQSGDTDVSA